MAAPRLAKNAKVAQRLDGQIARFQAQFWRDTFTRPPCPTCPIIREGYKTTLTRRVDAISRLAGRTGWTALPCQRRRPMNTRRDALWAELEAQPYWHAERLGVLAHPGGGTSTVWRSRQKARGAGQWGKIAKSTQGFG